MDRPQGVGASKFLLKCDWVYEFVSMVQDEKEMDVPSPNEFEIVNRPSC